MSAATVCASPNWLHNKFLEIALRSGGEDGIIVMCSSVNPATSVGDNYMSEMFRIKLQIAKDGKTEERSVILKTVPKKESMLKVGLRDFSKLTFYKCPTRYRPRFRSKNNGHNLIKVCTVLSDSLGTPYKF